MPAEFHIIAPCPLCGCESTLVYQITDGDILLTPPVWFVQCANPDCNRLLRVTLMVSIEAINKKRKPPREFGPLKIAE